LITEKIFIEKKYFLFGGSTYSQYTMDLKFLLNPDTNTSENDKRTTIIEDEEDDEILPLTTIASDIQDESFFINNYEKEETCKNTKIQKIMTRVRRVTKYLKIWNKNDPDEDIRKSNYVLELMTPQKIKNYTVNEILSIIVYMMVKDKELDIPIEQIMRSATRASPCKKFYLTDTSEKVNTLRIKKIINSMEIIHNEKKSGMSYKTCINKKQNTIVEVSKDICDQMGYPEEIINNIPLYLHYTEDVSLASRNAKTIAAAYVQVLGDKYSVAHKKFKMNLTLLSKSVDVTSMSIRKAYKILKELMKE